MRWGYFNGVAPVVAFAQSANPVDLTARIAALLLAAVGRNETISAVELAGAGLGDVFTVRLESGPTASFLAASSVVPSVTSFVPIVYMADNTDELAAARARAYAGSSFTPPQAVIGSEMAGATQARRVCVLEMVGVVAPPP